MVHSKSTFDRFRGLRLVTAMLFAFGLGATAMPLASAQLRSPAVPGGATPGSSPNIVAFSVPSLNQTHLLYLIDTQTRAFAVYQVNPAGDKGALKLAAVRKFAADLQLDEFNNTGLEVAAVESMVKTLKSKKLSQGTR